MAFDENGDRINAEYKIINVQINNSSAGVPHREHVPVGEFVYNKVGREVVDQFRTVLKLCINGTESTGLCTIRLVGR